MTIRPATAEDLPAILQLVEAAFGQPDEARLVGKLYADGDVAISLVAEAEGIVVGHVLASPMAAPFPALGLAPLSVRPDRQRMGHGSALTEAAISSARAGGWQGIFLLGDERYYSRFGFRADLAAGFACAYAGPHFQFLPLADGLPREGPVSYAKAFAEL